MATVYPFAAWRYNTDAVPLQKVVTQPYDKITAEMQERYYAAHPNNLVRIILGKRQPGDGGENVYTRAAAYFRQWRQEGVLVQDSEPTLYAYSQEFVVPGSPGRQYIRRGFIGLGKLEPYSAGIVFRHEQTLAAPKVDRLNLLRATSAHFGQLFMLYSDPAAEVDEALGRIMRYPPDLQVGDDYGVCHRVWRIPGLVELIRSNMADKKLIIADGHHRYETALNYQAERRTQSGPAPEPGEAPYDRVMMTFFNVYGEGVVILPTHRVLFGLSKFSPGDLVRESRSFFNVRDVTKEFDAQNPTALLPQTSAGETAMLAVTSLSAFLFLANRGAPHPALEGLSSQQTELDIVRLHRVVIEGVLGISEEAVREQKHIGYLRDAREAVQRVRGGGANVAFLMNPVRIEQVRDMAFAGEVLPQKSTDFYPKLLSGLTIYALE
ncbi:MAG TPA: DUF1015 domain-containing protein [Terriglobales bacterium]|jgi:uncharacterized protein (DUF1015 family)|nr:DUF1015 domain-containing protein [Terriglobales bacterium]